MSLRDEIRTTTDIILNFKINEIKGTNALIKDDMGTYKHWQEFKVYEWLPVEVVKPAFQRLHQALFMTSFIEHLTEEQQQELTEVFNAWFKKELSGGKEE